MARYRDELEAAQARVAALEEQVRALSDQKAKKKPKKSAAARAGEASEPIAAARVLELAGHLDGSLVPVRAQVGGWVTLAAFLGLHGALAWVFTPRTDLGTLAWLFSFTVPLTMAFWVYRHGRVIADPSTPLTARGPFGPTSYHRTRGAAAAMLAVLAVGDVVWTVLGLPAMVRSTQAPRATTSP